MANNNLINKANSLNTPNTRWRQFRSCQAWVSDAVADRYRLIKSYRTIVAMVDTEEHIVFEFGKYSTTTSKQVTQIINSMFSGYTRELLDETNW